MNKRFLNSKKMFFLSTLSFMFYGLIQASSTPTMVVTNEALKYMQMFNPVGSAYVQGFSTLNSAISALTSDKKITYDRSSNSFKKDDGTALSGVSMSPTPEKINGNYMVMWTPQGGKSKAMYFPDNFYIALSEIGDDTHKIVASGETLSLLKVGMSLSNGKSIKIPFAASQLTAIESHFGSGKHGVTISFSLGSPSGGNQGMTINVKDHTGNDVSGFPINLTAATLKTTDNSSVPTGVTASGKFVQYQTNNMDNAVMIKTENHSFDFNEDASIVGGTVEKTLTQQLQALGANPEQSAVKNAIEAYYNNDSSTIRGAWTTISGDLSSAGLSSMTAALKAKLDKKIPVAKSGSGGGGRF